MNEPTLYDELGAETGLRYLVERFYFYMDTIPSVKPIREMHPQDLTEVKEKLFCFLSGWSGGPALFVERYGHPMLRARHLPFPIDKSARDMWLQCMLLAIEDLATEIDLEEMKAYELLQAFMRIADHMRNKAEPSVNEPGEPSPSAP
jgi:hemoglobin